MPLSLEWMQTEYTHASFDKDFKTKELSWEISRARVPRSHNNGNSLSVDLFIAYGPMTVYK